MRCSHLAWRKRLGLHYWQILEAIGVTKDQIAHRIEVNKSSVSRAFDSENDFAFSIKKLRQLRALVGKMIANAVLAVFELGPSRIVVMSTDYVTSAPFDQESDNAVVLAVQESIASLLAGEIRSTPLPSNVRAATLRLGNDQECVYIFKIRTTKENPNYDSLIHEYKHFIDLFKREIQRLKKLQGISQEKLKLPRARLG